MSTKNHNKATAAELGRALAADLERRICRIQVVREHRTAPFRSNATIFGTAAG